ncbi:MAG: 4-alpha-glucanotransferase [Oscillospiraceae bacterium]|nr:4-alpha-glucanotransferase [Oscillospiraceae bacterium]
MKKREAGVLLHISSLPSNHGIGTFGRSAYEFVDFLVEAGQTYWQVLPLGPTSYGDSPYQSFSTFAGNPYFIDLDFLVIDGFLEEKDLEGINWGTEPMYVDYAHIYENRFEVLRKAYKNFMKKGDASALSAFCEKEEKWLMNYALFMALKNLHGGKCWREWEKPFYSHDEKALEKFEKENEEEIGFWKYLQYEFSRQWKNLKNYANERGIKIIGDLPIYVADDSSDVWASPELFDFDEERRPRNVAGVPPDYFSENGQLWGNPIYNWEIHKATGYKWWLERLSSCREKYDVLRIDHFRAFADYYCIPFGSETAKTGEWKDGPGMDLFSRVFEELEGYPIIAEDLGDLSPAVVEFLKESGLPGMKILEFSFGSDDPNNDCLPYNFSKNCVCYPGTHDNMPVAGWLETASESEIKFCKEYINYKEGEDFCDAFIKTVLGTAANTAIIAMQDWLGTGKYTRMNEPSTSGGNWQWRLLKGQADSELAERMYHHAKLYGRLR